MSESQREECSVKEDRAALTDGGMGGGQAEKHGVFHLGHWEASFELCSHVTGALEPDCLGSASCPLCDVGQTLSLCLSFLICQMKQTVVGTPYHIGLL